ncbi:hypothetical protein SSX86_018895 [Deinandra increscens subsp. villosa]|uniref:Peptide deformylase n=1 Tax=Deinandra increscens subsp. villosa TaxID=3103831 RepID=A0AAP0CWV9_9ASTR
MFPPSHPKKKNTLWISPLSLVLNPNRNSSASHAPLTQSAPSLVRHHSLSRSTQATAEPISISIADRLNNQRSVTMASANWLHSSALSHASLPTTSHRRDTLLASFRPVVLYDKQSVFSSNCQYRPPAMVVQAQAKRGLLQKNEEEAASPADMHFEAPLKIVLYPDPKLRAKNKRVVTFDENLKKLVDEMFDVMYKSMNNICLFTELKALGSPHPKLELMFSLTKPCYLQEYEQYLFVYRTEGIGLSAPQVGVNVQLMVFNPVGERGEGEEIVLVNPRVIKSSKKLVPFTEGCLSFPGINADVVRPEAVKVDAQDISGANFSVSLSRLPSRVFQHEFDHLEGVLFFDRMTAEVVDSIRAELMALEQKYEDTTGLLRPESIETRKRWKAAAGFGRS